MQSTASSEQKRQESKEMLQAMIKEGDTIYTVLTHVSASGMSRDIKVLIGNSDNSITDISMYVANTLEYKRAKSGDIKVSGCGMDMGYHVVYSLSKELFKNTEQKDSGYVLNHRWL